MSSIYTGLSIKTIGLRHRLHYCSSYNKVLIDFNNRSERQSKQAGSNRLKGLKYAQLFDKAGWFESHELRCFE